MLQDIDVSSQLLDFARVRQQLPTLKTKAENDGHEGGHAQDCVSARSPKPRSVEALLEVRVRDAQVLPREVEERPRLLLRGRVPYQLLLHSRRVALIPGQQGRHRGNRTIFGGRITALRVNSTRKYDLHIHRQLHNLIERRVGSAIHLASILRYVRKSYSPSYVSLRNLSLSSSSTLPPCRIRLFFLTGEQFVFYIYCEFICLCVLKNIARAVPEENVCA